MVHIESHLKAKAPLPLIYRTYSIMYYVLCTWIWNFLNGSLERSVWVWGEKWSIFIPITVACKSIKPQRLSLCPLLLCNMHWDIVRFKLFPLPNTAATGEYSNVALSGGITYQMLWPVIMVLNRLEGTRGSTMNYFGGINSLFLLVLPLQALPIFGFGIENWTEVLCLKDLWAILLWSGSMLFFL
jgi:hypothetical protein